MDLQDEVIESLRLEDDNRDDEWQHDDAVWEECNSNASKEAVVAAAVLQLDYILPSQSVQVLPNELVLIDEHSHQEAEKQDVEDVNEDCDESLTLWECEIIKILLTIECIEDIKNNLEHCRVLLLQLFGELHSNNDE